MKFKKLNFRWKQKWPLSTRRNPSPTPQLNPKFPQRRPNNLGKTILKKSFKDIFHHSRSTSEILFPLNHMILVFFYCTFPSPFQKSLLAPVFTNHCRNYLEVFFRIARKPLNLKNTFNPDKNLSTEISFPKIFKRVLGKIVFKIILFAPDPETKNLQIYEPFRDYFLGSFENLHFSGIFRQNINSKTVFFINVHEFMLIKALTIFVCE